MAVDHEVKGYLSKSQYDFFSNSIGIMLLWILA